MIRTSRVLAAIAVVGAMALATTTGVASANNQSSAHRAASGGDITFGLEAESNSFCTTKAQLAISGIQVVAAVYDTLTVPNDKGLSVPYLAKSVTPNSDFTIWTIGLRDGVKFHDGSPVDADAIKANLDSFRGAPGAANAGSLLPIVLSFMQDVTVTDPTTVTVTLNTPVSTFPDYLFLVGRMGIMAPAQLNSENCATNLIGSGPFKFVSQSPNEKLVVTKNPDYWQKGYPKANQITFVPVPDSAVRVNQLKGGQLDMLHTSGAVDIDTLKNDSSVNTLIQKPGYREIRYYAMLSDSAPFNNPEARLAFSLALDRNKINAIQNKGLFTPANGLMDIKAPGYLKNAGYPKFSLTKAKALVTKVKAANGGAFDVILGTTTDATNTAEAQLVQEQLKAAGIEATIAQYDQATLINKALAGDIDVLFWRNLHGGYSKSSDADNYPWWSNYNTPAGKKNFINFSRFDDTATQDALTKGRSESTVSAAKTTYTAFNKAFAAGNYILPTWYINWTIASQKSVSVNLPALPDGGGKPLFVYGRIPVLGLSSK
ncbi:MAG: ABC transporter substrate-binding protein [Actinobacteria bacterium]|nr:ABC transporter substrate-binding protein [Actinomycetota bacterium]